jgi:hypothetical protein
MIDEHIKSIKRIYLKDKVRLKIYKYRNELIIPLRYKSKSESPVFRYLIMLFL